MKGTTAILGLLAVSLPHVAHATCPSGAIPQALKARLDAQALPLVTGLLVDNLPTQMDMPLGSYVLAECPDGFDDNILTIKSGTIDMLFSDLTVTLVNGALEVDGILDATANGDMAFQLCAMPDTECPGKLTTTNIKIHGRMEPTVAACVTAMPLTVVEITVDPYATTMQLNGCGLYDEITQGVYDWYRDTVVEMLVTQVEAALRDELPLFLADTIDGLLADGFEMYGLRFAALPDGISIDKNAIEVSFTANVTPAAGQAACVPAEASLPEENASVRAPTPPADGLLTMTMSQPFVQRGVRAAWLSGWLCFNTVDYSLDLGEYLDPIAPGAMLRAALAVTEPPTVNLGQSGDAYVQVSSEALSVEVNIEVPGAAAPAQMLALASAELAGEVRLDQALQALTLEILDVTSPGLSLQASEDANLVFSEGTLRGIMDKLLMPAFAANIGPLPLTSGLFVTAPVAVRLDHMAVFPSHVQASIDMCAIDHTDRVSPSTLISRLPPSPARASSTFMVASTDDRTPNDFMRHRVLVDGQLVQAFASGDVIALDNLSGGDHQVRVIAIDLNDNEDPTPVELTVHVDAVLPVVTVLEAPYGVSRAATTTLKVAAVDDETPASQLQLWFTAGVWHDDGSPDGSVIAGSVGDVAADGSIELTSLPENKIVRVTVFAMDAAGNVGSSSASFGVDHDATFNCQAVSGGQLSGLVVLLGLLRLRRGHRR